jgi:hypothetical protein
LQHRKAAISLCSIASEKDRTGEVRPNWCEHFDALMKSARWVLT